MNKGSKKSYEVDVKNYFSEKATGYDLVEEQAYWRLSDTLLWDMLSALILENMPKTFRFLDAGGGTGRWSERLLREFPDCVGQTADLSSDMLAMAQDKRLRGGKSLHDRWSIEQTDLHELQSDNEYDLVLCFHNVLGFVWDSDLVLENLARALKPGGILVLVAPNKFHGIYFNLTLTNLDGAEGISKDNVGVFTAGMPSMDFFEPDDLCSHLESLALTNIQTRGFPIFVYPGHPETQISGQTKSLGKLLDNEENFNRICEIERAYSKHTKTAWRGNNFFLTARKIGDS